MYMNKTTLLIGASTKPQRYAFKAITELRAHDHRVYALAIKEGKVEDVEFQTTKAAFEDVDTVTLYVGPQHQADYMDYVISLKPKRVIFNPGTENPEFQEKLEAEGITPVEACTLVLLKTNQY
jgi:predicted CoA-binding protein